MRQLLFLISVLLPFSSYIAAQESYSRVSLAYEVMDFHYDDGYADDDTPKGLSFGYAHGFALSASKPLYIEAGAKLAWTHLVHNRRPLDVWVTRMDFLDMSLPVDLTYKFSLFSGNIGLVPSTGPNFRFNIIGRQKKSYYELSKGKETEKINFLARDEAYPAAIFQFGWRAGVAISHGPFSIGYNFTYDFTPYREVMISKYGHLGDTKTAHHTLSVGYTF